MRYEALKVAMELAAMPSRVRHLRLAPLPTGVSDVLEIVAGEEAAIEDAVRFTGRSRTDIVEAAAFFVEQVMFHPDADSYRVLGASAGATTSDLRRNMALLLRWLHPDIENDAERAVFTKKVTLAWNDLKTEERRLSYERSVNGSRRARWPFRKRRGGNGSGRGSNRLAKAPRHQKQRGLGLLEYLMRIFGGEARR